MQAIGEKLRPYVQCCHYICKGFHHCVEAFSSRLTFGQMESSEGASGSIEAAPQLHLPKSGQVAPPDQQMQPGMLPPTPGGLENFPALEGPGLQLESLL